jgi:hypothetical protein
MFAHKLLRFDRTDTQRGVLPGIPESAICVQRFDDSLNSAIRITYRISLRSSSLHDPRYPLLRVVQYFVKLINRRLKQSDKFQKIRQVIVIGLKLVNSSLPAIACDNY